MIFVLLLNVFLLAAAIINCGGKKKNDFPQPQPTQPAPVASAKKEEGSKEPEKSADKPKEDEAKKAEGGEKKADADNKIADAIKKGDMLPANDNETLNDCESNWGAGVIEVSMINETNYTVNILFFHYSTGFVTFLVTILGMYCIWVNTAPVYVNYRINMQVWMGLTSLWYSFFLVPDLTARGIILLGPFPDSISGGLFYSLYAGMWCSVMAAMLHRQQAVEPLGSSFKLRKETVWKLHVFDHVVYIVPSGLLYFFGKQKQIEMKTKSLAIVYFSIVVTMAVLKAAFLAVLTHRAVRAASKTSSNESLLKVTKQLTAQLIVFFICVGVNPLWLVIASFLGYSKTFVPMLGLLGNVALPCTVTMLLSTRVYRDWLLASLKPLCQRQAGTGSQVSSSQSRPPPPNQVGKL